MTLDSLGGERESYSAIGVEITLRRKYLPFIIDYYLPSGLFVVVSWVCESEITVSLFSAL